MLIIWKVILFIPSFIIYYLRFLKDKDINFQTIMFAILAVILMIQWFEDLGILIMMVSDFTNIVHKRQELIKENGN